jgi:hypothetical protein
MLAKTALWILNLYLTQYSLAYHAESILSMNNFTGRPPCEVNEKRSNSEMAEEMERSIWRRQGLQSNMEKEKTKLIWEKRAYR